MSFEFDPGTKYQYSGEGYEYLRHALERKFNKTLDQLADSLLFKPLQMTDTRFVWDTKMDESRYAIGYDTSGKAYQTVRNSSPNAADDLLTTIQDYSTFLIALLNQYGLSKEVYAEMIRHQATIKKNEFFGLGLVIYDLGNGDYALSHSGADEGAQTIFVLLPKTKKGIVIFTNVDGGYKTYEKLINTYLGEEGRKIIAIETK